MTATAGPLWRTLRRQAQTDAWALRQPPRPTERFPFDPLIPIIERRYQQPAKCTHVTIAGKTASVLQRPASSVYKWMRSGLTVKAADQVAVRLGYHPGEIWPEWWQA